jgi:hypothetical protein
MNANQAVSHHTTNHHKSKKSKRSAFFICTSREDHLRLARTQKERNTTGASDYNP